MNNISGPLPIEEFRALADAPHGAAAKIIRKYDPLYGLMPGEKITWIVSAEREVTQEGYAEIKASSEEEAKALAGELMELDFDWDDNCGAAHDITSVEPKR